MSPRVPMTRALLLVVPLLAGCSSTNSGFRAGPAKAFSEDQTFVLIDRQRDVVAELAKDRGASSVHETYNRREVLAVTGDGRLTPVIPTPPVTKDGDDDDDDDEPTDPVAETPASPALPDLIEGGAARPYESLFAEQLDRAALARSYEALFSGDTDMLDSSRAVSLIRVDLSVGGANVSARALSPSEDERHYALAYFDVTDPTGSDVRVYALSPAKASIVARESLARSILEDYGGGVTAPVAGGAAKAEVSGRLQRQREEQFTSLVEHPIQFALHGESHDQFAFAFGPRRRVVKRSWINPKRWFGSAYRFDYDMEPGPRWGYALVVHDVSATQLHIRTAWSENLVAEDEVRETCTDCAVALERKVAMTEIGLEADATTVRIARTTRPVTTAVHGSVHPSTTSTFVIDCASPVNGESRVFVGPVAVPDDKVRLLGRHRLAVTIAKSKLLEALRKAGRTTVDARVITPGVADSSAVIPLEAGPADSAKPAPAFKVEPAHGSPGQLLTVTFAKIQQSSVTEVRLGGVIIPRTDFVIDAKKPKQLRIPVPQPGRVLPAGAQPLLVNYVEQVGGAAKSKQVVIADVFTYQR